MTNLSVSKIRKRSGRVVDFDSQKIFLAIIKSMRSVGEVNKEKAKSMTGQAEQILEKRFDGHTIPGVEEIQDIVEEVLIKNRQVAVAKSYILYRDLHNKIRSINSLVDSDEMVMNYIQKLDWRVKENSNMTYSLQGLNNHVAGLVSSNYWLNQIYPAEVREAHLNGDLHLHDLAILAAYCCGWDLQDFLRKGFGGVPGKINAKPPKHLGTALAQLVNLIYTLQGETAGAQAVSNFDTLLAPFIYYDKLTYKQVKQCLQEFMFGMNVPTRVGFQCVSEDTEILTPEGWKSYSEIKKGTIVKTYNIITAEIEDLPTDSVFQKKYKGIMYNLKNRIQDQLVSPGHRVVRKLFNTNNYILEPIEEAGKLKSSLIIPIAGKNINKKAKLGDEQIKLLAWITSEGTIERPTKYRCCYRVSIYQSKNNKDNCKEIKELLSYFNLKYDQYESTSLGDSVWRARLSAESSRVIHQWFGTKENVHFLPEILLNMDLYQSRLFLETYLKGDGFEGCKITTTDVELLDGLQQLIVNCSYGFTVLRRKPTIGKKELFVLRIIRHPETYITKISKVDYEGVVWCPHTRNETIIARRKGKVFITGNTPFSNITLDLVIPSMLTKEPVIVAGQPQSKNYGDFQEEVNIFNKALGEVMLEGDAQGRVFSFPIPTINITKDFDWNNPYLENLWEATRKYGIPYFSNFVNSDMKPEDARSMCPLAGDEKVLIRSRRGRNLEYCEIRNIFEGNAKENDYEIFSDGEFIQGKFNKFENQQLLRITLANGHQIRMSDQHLNFVLNDERIEVVKTLELKESMYLPYSLKTYKGEGGNYDLGYFVGAFAGDGSFDGETSVVFSLENELKKDVIDNIERIAGDYFSAHITKIQNSKTKLFTLKVHSQGAVGLCKDFIEGKEREKCYKARLFGTSVDFRKGIIDGHYATDGGNRHRIYTSSSKMVQSLNMLAATLGTTTAVYKDDRDNRLGKEANYAVLIYQLNRKNYGDFWKKFEGKLWVKITKIERNTNSSAYCFEVENGEPMFTVGTTGILTHNCRLRLDNRELRKKGGGLFGANPLTGSVGVVTINLPRIGYLYKTKQEFYERLGHLMDMAKDSLVIKRRMVEEFTEKGLYPYSRYYLEGVKERFGEYWKNHFNTIGLVGMNEACLNFLGKDISEEKGREFALEVLDFMRKRMANYQKEQNQLFNLEATPAEGTSYRFAREDRKRFKDIIFANDAAVKEKKVEPFYTNSTQLPVGSTDDIFSALTHQDELQCKYTGGTVFHGFLGESLPDIESVKKVVKKIAHQFHLPYYTISPTFSVCPIHGYIAGEHFYCPKCDDDIAEERVKLEKEGYKVEIEE